MLNIVIVYVVDFSIFIAVKKKAIVKLWNYPHVLKLQNKIGLIWGKNWALKLLKNNKQTNKHMLFVHSNHSVFSNFIMSLDIC